MLFIMLFFFFAQMMLKNMLFALHYAKLFQILLNYALRQKYMSSNTAGPNNFASMQAPVLQKSISRPSWYRCKSRLITEG